MGECENDFFPCVVVNSHPFSLFQNEAVISQFGKVNKGVEILKENFSQMDPTGKDYDVSGKVPFYDRNYGASVLQQWTLVPVAQALSIIIFTFLF